MTHPCRPSLPCLAIALAAAFAAGGCSLNREPIIGSWAQATPAQFCPGDEVALSYDFLGTETCRNATACAAFQPNVVVTSSPAAFAPRSFAAYGGSFTFVPAADTAITFDVDRDEVRIPTSRVDPEGLAIDVLRTNVRDVSLNVRRLTGSTSTELVHDGMCAGSTPVNAPAMLPGPPALSANLRLVNLCNRNAVPVMVTLSGSASGSSYSQTLIPNECLDTSAPGVPAGIDGSRTVEVRSMIPDPGARCSATGPNTLPAPLRTVAQMACR